MSGSRFSCKSHGSWNCKWDSRLALLLGPTFRPVASLAKTPLSALGAEAASHSVVLDCAETEGLPQDHRSRDLGASEMKNARLGVAPVRSSRPSSTSATSLIRTGSPSRVAATIFRSRAMSATCPGCRSGTARHDVPYCRAAVGVVPCNSVESVVHRRFVGQQLDRIGRDMELTHVAADGVDLGDTFQIAQL